ncbi:MAG: hypothetical protein ABF384_16710 [Verrucomicrobiales bacterium]
MKPTICAAGLVAFLSSTTVAESREGKATSGLLFEPKDEACSRAVPLKEYLPKAELPCPVVLFSLSTLFSDAYLKGDSDAKSKLQSEAARGEAGLVEGDIWEWK